MSGATELECPVCFNLDFNSHPVKWKGGEELYQRIVKYPELRPAAERGCRVCSIVLEGIEVFEDGLDPIGIETLINLRCKSSFPFGVGVETYKGAGPKWLEFFTVDGESMQNEYRGSLTDLKGKPAPWSAIGTSNIVPERLDVEVAKNQALKWLHECEDKQKHRDCRRREQITKLPTRVLDLGEKPTLQDPIKLVEIEGIDRKAKYMTLSHCWGQVQFITTTRGTIEKRKAGIQLEDLPQTFKDAVSLTRSLGIQYLWIDSLCIIQQDKKDWEIEAGRMRSVYANSYLNIAATGSSSGSGGCFRERSALTAGPFPRVSAVKTHQIHRPYLKDSSIYVRLSLNSAHGALAKTGLLEGESSQLAPLVSLLHACYKQYGD